MAASVGRRITFYWGGNSPGADIAGVREKGINVAGEPIDVTSDEDSGWRTLLENPAQNEVNISLSGVTKDERLRNDFFNGNRTQIAQIVWPNGAILSGTFYLASLEITGAYNDAATFSAELQSSGAVTFTPGS